MAEAGECFLNLSVVGNTLEQAVGVTVLSSNTHLAYYRQHQISPVRQDISDLAGHFARRAALYRCLGLLPSDFRHQRILEVAPGSGHNSLWVASRQPARFDLVEPNATAVEEMEALYAALPVPHTPPKLHATTLDLFETEQRYDVVICENWLGNAPAELTLLRKLARFVDDDGVLVVTTVSPLGIVPNLLRKSLGLRLVAAETDFGIRTEMLVRAFASHLATMPAMTRPHVDWVRDNLLNPAYCGICLSIPVLIEQLAAEYDVLQCLPRFEQEWRWYKELGHDSFNEHLLAAYEEQIHNFLDHRVLMPPRERGANRAAELDAFALVEAVRAQEQGDQGATQSVADAARKVLSRLDDTAPAIRAGLEEAILLLTAPAISEAAIAEMDFFRGLFGRETQYVSLHRARSGTR